MPEHVHLLLGEPKVGTLSVVMQVLKQRVSRKCRASVKQTRLSESDLPQTFWQTRYYDFNVGTRKKYLEKLNYIHFNPVKRGLVKSPDEWRWSSCRFYWLGEKGPLKIGES
jgi:REP-associated tyrosine transposase